MLFLVKVTLDTPTTNEVLRRGEMETTIQSILAELKPEAAYFTDDNGRRTGILVVEMASTSDIPRIAEPWFLAFNAEVQFKAAMRPEDLGKASPAIAAAAKKY